MQTRDLVAELIKSCNATLMSDIAPAPAGDVDLYVLPDMYDAALRLICDNGFVLTYKKPAQAVGRRFENGQLFLIDILSDFNVYTKAAPFLRLSPAGAARMAKSPMLHACFKNLCYARYAKIAIVEKNWREFLDFLSNAENFERPLASSMNFSNATPQSLFAQVEQQSFVRRNLEALRFYWEAMGTGVSFAFVGPDGSGKSFFIDKLRDIGPTTVVYMGDWFFAMQRLYIILMKVPSPWNRFLYIFYFIENLVRYARVLMLRLRGRVVLIDRFPGTNRNIRNTGLLFRINQLIFRIFPKPDHLIFLYAPPEVIHQRKQELSVEEIREQHACLHRILAGTPYSVINTENLDDSLNTLLAAYGQSVH